MKRLIFIILFFCSVSGAYSYQDSREIYTLGLEAFRSGAYSSAELLFRKIINRDDSYRDNAWFYLARSIFNQGKYRSAIFEFNSFLTKCRTEILRVESRFWIGESYYMIREYLKAIEEYKRFVAQSKNAELKIDAYEKIGLIYYNDSRFEESVIEYENAIKISNDRNRNAELIYRIGMSYFKSGEFRKAIERIEPLIYTISDTPVKMKLRVLLGRIYQKMEDHKRAIITFNTIPKKFAGTEQFLDVYYFRAVSYNMTENYKKARNDLEIFTSVASKSEFYFNGLFLLGKIQIKLGNVTSGEFLLDKVWNDSKRVELEIESAFILSELLIDRHPERTVSYLEKFSRIENGDKKKKVFLLLSRAYLKSGQYNKCRESADYFLGNFKYDDSLDEIYFIKARVSLELGDFEEASKNFDMIRQENPFSKYLDETRYFLGLLNFKKNNFNEALRLLEIYTKNRDSKYYVESMIMLLDINASMKRWSTAKKYANLLIDDFGDFSNVCSHIVKYAFLNFDYDKKNAESFFRRILKKYPHSEFSMEIYQFQGDHEYSNENYKDAIRFYEKYLNSNSSKNRGLTFYRLLNSYYITGDYEKCVSLIERGSIPPLSENQWKEIPFIHARSYYKLRKYEEVYSLLKYDDISKFNDDDAFMLIDSTVKLGNIGAAKLYLKDVENNKLYMKSVIIISDYLIEKGNISKSIDILQDALLSEKKINGVESDTLKLKLAKSLILMNDFSNVETLLKSVRSSSLTPDMVSLRIIFLFKTGKIDEAVTLTKNNLALLNKSIHRIDIYKLNLEYSFTVNNTRDYQYFSKKLYIYDSEYINYMNGKLYYKNGQYTKSFSSFSRLLSRKNLYFMESSYYAGMINLYYYRNFKKAVVNFKNVEESDYKNIYSVMSGLELAKIYAEKNKKTLSREILDRIENSDVSAKHILKARNLKEYYGYE